MPGRWAGSTRRRTLPPDWPAIRARILMRDGRACTDTTGGRRCGTRATHVDHVIPHSQGGTDADDNLTSLCAPHHALKSSREGAQAARAVRAKSRRPVERHPGLVTPSD